MSRWLRRQDGMFGGGLLAAVMGVCCLLVLGWWAYGTVLLVLGLGTSLAAVTHPTLTRVRQERAVHEAKERDRREALHVTQSMQQAMVMMRRGQLSPKEARELTDTLRKRYQKLHSGPAPSMVVLDQQTAAHGVVYFPPAGPVPLCRSPMVAKAEQPRTAEQLVADAQLRVPTEDWRRVTLLGLCRDDG